MSVKRFSSRYLLLSLIALGWTSGCQQTRSQYVEAELRHQCRRVHELEEKLAGKDAEIETLKSTLGTFQASYVKPTEAPETVYRETALSKINLTMITGGEDADRDGKDDGIIVGVSPLDYDGDAFKCPGTCHVDLFEIPESGVKKHIGHWDYSPELLRKRWKSSLMGQGYQLATSWMEPPTEPKLRVEVCFQTLDGRKFAAEKDFRVRTKATKAPSKPGGQVESESDQEDGQKDFPIMLDMNQPNMSGSPNKQRQDHNIKHAIESPTPADEADFIQLPKVEPTSHRQVSELSIPHKLATELEASPLPLREKHERTLEIAAVRSSPEIWPTTPRWSDMVRRSNFFANHQSAQ
jgi:hypothetical protein